MHSPLPFLLLLICCTFSCSPKVYEDPRMASLAAEHRIVAIVPPNVSLKGRPKDDPETLAAAAEEDTYTFQREIYSWMLRRKQQGKIRGLEIMDPATTNAKLTKAGYGLDDRNKTPAEIAELLGVDAIITTRFDMSKPMSQGAAIALGVLFGVGGTTNQARVNMDIHDADAGLIWHYDWEASGSYLNTSEQLVDGLMRNASKRMPYTIN